MLTIAIAAVLAAQVASGLDLSRFGEYGGESPPPSSTLFEYAYVTDYTTVHRTVQPSAVKAANASYSVSANVSSNASHQKMKTVFVTTTVPCNKIVKTVFGPPKAKTIILTTTTTTTAPCELTTSSTLKQTQKVHKTITATAHGSAPGVSTSKQSGTLGNTVYASSYPASSTLLAQYGTQEQTRPASAVPCNETASHAPSQSGREVHGATSVYHASEEAPTEHAFGYLTGPVDQYASATPSVAKPTDYAYGYPSPTEAQTLSTTPSEATSTDYAHEYYTPSAAGFEFPLATPSKATVSALVYGPGLPGPLPSSSVPISYSSTTIAHARQTAWYWTKPQYSNSAATHSLNSTATVTITATYETTSHEIYPTSMVQYPSAPSPTTHNTGGYAPYYSNGTVTPGLNSTVVIVTMTVTPTSNATSATPAPYPSYPSYSISMNATTSLTPSAPTTQRSAWHWPTQYPNVTTTPILNSSVSATANATYSPSAMPSSSVNTTMPHFTYAPATPDYSELTSYPGNPLEGRTTLTISTPPGYAVPTTTKSNSSSSSTSTAVVIIPVTNMAYGYGYDDAPAYPQPTHHVKTEAHGQDEYYGYAAQPKGNDSYDETSVLPSFVLEHSTSTTTITKPKSSSTMVPSPTDEYEYKPAVHTTVLSADPRCPYPYPGVYCGEAKTTLVTETEKSKSKSKPSTTKKGYIESKPSAWCPYPGEDC